MANSVVITNESKASSTGEVTFTITNATASALKAQCKLRALGSTKVEYFNLRGGAQVDGAQANKATQQLELPPKGTHQVTAKIDPKAPPGEHKICLLVWSVADPDGDCAEGQVCTVTQAPPAATPARTFPIWAIAAIVAFVVVVGGGITTWALWPDGNVEVPNLVGMSFNEAQQTLQKLELTAKRNDVVNNAVAAGQITAQNPAASTKVDPKTTNVIALTVSKHEVPPPPPVAFVDFLAPKVDGWALDICREWGANCGKPAADAFCVKQGLAEATDFLTAFDQPPSRVIATGQICNQAMCDRITWVRCAKTRSLTVTAVRLDPAILQRAVMKQTIQLK